MKKLLIASLIFGTAVVQAATVTVYEAHVVGARSGDMTNSIFQVNKTTGEGFVKVSVTREEYNPWDYQGPGGGWDHCTPYGGCIPRPMPRPMPTMRTLFNEMIEVEGLSLHGDRMVFAAASGDVECGTYGYSRILRRPTIYLSGKCSTNAWVDRDGKLTVTLTTK